MPEETIENKIILYETEDGRIKVDVFFADENFWMSQKTMSELFDVQKAAISKHLKNIYESGELTRDSTVSIMETVQNEGERHVKRSVEYYNLDAIIAVGYRVNSHKATRFRIWATQTLKEYILKGFVLNDEMLKNGRPFVQNKLHYAITGQTAAEIIHDRADSEHPTMGLTNWKASPGGKILKSDVKVAKNYLNAKELDRLNRIVTMYIDYAEFQALNEQIMTMKDWIEITDRFLQYNRQEVLQDAGRISHQAAMDKVQAEYEKFRVKQDREYISNFDQAIRKYLEGEK